MGKSKKSNADGTSRFLWESDADWRLYESYADQRIKYGLEERSLDFLARSSGKPLAVIQALHDTNSWEERVKIFDKFWEPEVPTGIERQLVEAEAKHFELGAIAANILGNRLQTQPHLLSTNQLIAIARLMPTISRSQATISSDKGGAA